MTDEQIARQVLLELFPKGTWAKGARETGVEGKTFERICKGTTTIKPANMEKLLAYAPFSVAFARAKGASEPQLDRKTREAMGRLATALGPRVLALVVVEIESLARLCGPEKTINALERLVETARDVLDSKEESQFRQKID